MLQTERNRWQYRARAALRASGRTLRTGGHYLLRSLKGYLEVASDLEVPLRETLALCQRQETALALEPRQVDTELRRKARAIDAIKRLETIPAVGDLVATTIYAWAASRTRSRWPPTPGSYRRSTRVLRASARAGSSSRAPRRCGRRSCSRRSCSLAAAARPRRGR
jgi:hypothetical protein